MTEVTRAEFERLRRDVARHETQYAVISTKLTAILWLLTAVGSAVIAGTVKLLFGGTL